MEELALLAREGNDDFATAHNIWVESAAISYKRLAPFVRRTNRKHPSRTRSVYIARIRTNSRGRTNSPMIVRYRTNSREFARLNEFAAYRTITARIRIHRSYRICVPTLHRIRCARKNSISNKDVGCLLWQRTCSLLTLKVSDLDLLTQGRSPLRNQRRSVKWHWRQSKRELADDIVLSLSQRKPKSLITL